MVRFIEKSGESIEEAIIILEAINKSEAIFAEYEYISRKFGIPKRDWILERQTLIMDNGKFYDKMEIKLFDGTAKILYFDVTPFFKTH